jgi:glutaminyl-tRNA synthetase
MAAREAETPAGGRRDFIREIVASDLDSGRHEHIVTRFPPEPNGYLHIGHTKAFCLNFGLPLEFPGKAVVSRCHLRMDDTNPAKEEVEYVESIKEDIRWMGFDWGEHFYFTSDYYEQLHGFAVGLIEKGLAYVDSLSSEEIRSMKGSDREPGQNSPFRDRPVEENLDLFARMRAGEFEEGAHVLRARIDMAHPNFHMRDPVIYRILKIEHHRTGNDWCIYPLYDFAHPLSDALEGITHSLCSLEFENHRPLYDWFVANTSVPHTPRQIEFARLNLSYTVMSKRKLLRLVKEGYVSGWDDPRMPTLSGMRRLGYTPAAIRKFIATIGLTKANSLTDLALLEHCVREDLNATSPRVMAVLDPLKVTITNYPEGGAELVSCVNNPEDEGEGTREVPFSATLYIEREDFREEAPRNFFRLKPGKEVRLLNSYVIRCDEVVKDAEGRIVELLCSYDPQTLGANPVDGRKVKGVLHWVSAWHARDVEVRLYDRLFRSEQPEASGEDFVEDLNPGSLQVITAKAEPLIAGERWQPGTRVQFSRLGYFCADRESTADAPVFNRTATLKDGWAGVNRG